ncbi:hypothetical protein ANOM_009026 [Aspergillus nomiae NRRL 13137]|uniref:Uncharacterized protein n=1 Tax=Aspergillus nomiae NRRL (strain ATCC 15546 / NRRL 13137 / CBS 260.88 / M93) TaxID=1509407 RepID=A0A0L1IRV6_ASPN3|nr:uncharacterized protein ANOM_009026 [Aspergillus nomiae NRRL 13137]KNG82321.1 hypothetical protein ANOM_009026 [Aspergillus nomiae NRRL 13137]
MASTTLMTFLLYTNPQVKSVKLLGSWDNFTKSYPMEHDRRVGQGHWRGCHSFTSIICDGTPKNMGSSRSGGLKMGGTYWYYYLLDDDVEYYNHAEPFTSHCPLLPGQPVNVLHVPVILPDTRPIYFCDRSSSPQQTEERTMNPDDKYMNPRNPPKPALPRLRTSPPLLQQPTPAWSFSTSPLGLLTNRGASQPNSATPKVTIQYSQRAPDTKTARSVSPPRSRGLRAAFRQWNASSPDLSVADNQNSDSTKPRLAFKPVMGRTESLIPPENTSKESLLPRRPASPVHPVNTVLSIQDRRALNPKNTDRATPRTPLTLQTNHETNTTRNGDLERAHPHAPQDSVASVDSTSLLATALPVAVEDAVTPTPFTSSEKRLPTLPNSPSSVMDEALRDLEAREKELDAENLGSHFSDFSATESTSSSPCERSHFSEWSTDTEVVSAEFMTPSLPFNNGTQTFSALEEMSFAELWKTSVPAETSDPNTPQLTVNSRSSPTTLSGDSPLVDLPLPRLTVSLSPSDIDFSGLGIGDSDEVERDPKRHAAFFGGIEGLGLLRSPEPSTVHFAGNIRDDAETTHNVSNDRFSISSLPGQSAAMQEMMDELSYLKSMIQS